MPSVKTKAAKQAAKSRAARKAAVASAKSPAGRKAAAMAARRKAAEVTSRARAQASDAGLDERAAELAERVRESDAFLKAQAKGTDFAERTRQRVKEAELDEKATELAERVRNSDAAQQALTTVQRLSDEQLERLGGWLARGKTAQKLGVRSSKRRVPAWLAVVAGVAAGYVIGLLTAPKRGEELRSDLVQQSSGLRDDLATTAQRLQQDTEDAAAPPAQKPLADKVRTRLGEDPRTSELPKLNVNVAEGTVFVRGSVPSGFDEDAIRAVIASVPGVEDVDLQLSAST